MAMPTVLFTPKIAAAALAVGSRHAPRKSVIQCLGSSPQPGDAATDSANPGADEPRPSPSPQPAMSARDRLRAARVLRKYAAAGKPRGEFGSKVLSALKEMDGGKRRRSGLPEAPADMFEDGKSGKTDEKWSITLPMGGDLVAIAASFFIISAVMLGTTYLVWKAGAIHFNEY